jgi:hypothetical protein
MTRLIQIKDVPRLSLYKTQGNFPVLQPFMSFNDFVLCGVYPTVQATTTSQT